MKTKVVIIGAGISGLTAAYFLTKSGYDVLVLEQEDAPGGRMRQLELHGLRVNSGARILYTFYTVVMELIRELHLQEEIEYVGLSELMCDAGEQSYPVSFSLRPGLIFSSILGKATRLRLLSLFPDLLKARFTTDPNDMCSSRYADKESMETYLSRKVGSEFIQKIVDPLFRGARSWNANDVSPAFFLTTSAHLPGHKAFTFRKGIGYLAETLAAKLKIKYGLTVKNIQRNENKTAVFVDYSDSDGDSRLKADIVVCATEGAKISKLVNDKNDAERRFMPKVKYNSLGIVYHVLKHAPKHSVTFYTKEHPTSLAILETVSGENSKPHLFCELAPETIREVIRDNAQEKMAQLITSDVRKRYSSFDEHLDYSVNQWIEHMLPVFYPGYISSLETFMEHQNLNPRLIYYCGDYMSQALVGGACASGKKVAMSIIDHWGRIH